MYLYLYSYRRETARCFSAVAELLVYSVQRCYAAHWTDNEEYVSKTTSKILESRTHAGNTFRLEIMTVTVETSLCCKIDSHAVLQLAE